MEIVIFNIYWVESNLNEFLSIILILDDLFSHLAESHCAESFRHATYFYF